MRTSLALVPVAALFFATPALADNPPMRHLVYSFTYGTQQDSTSRSQDTESTNAGGFNGGGSGLSHYGGSAGDKGTMTVDILSEQPDHGLVVSISEQGESSRKAPAATCVAYGNTTVICDPNRTVNSEEYTLLRFLASNFIDPLAVDSKQHWAVDQGSADNHVTADYTILSNDKGIMTVNEARTIKQRGSGMLTTTVQTKITYDFAHLVPTAIDEYAQQRGENGIAGTSKTVYQTTLNLVSDSAAKK